MLRSPPQFGMYYQQFTSQQKCIWFSTGVKMKRFVLFESLLTLAKKWFSIYYTYCADEKDIMYVTLRIICRIGTCC